MLVDPNILLAADALNKNVRVINTATNQVTSLCMNLSEEESSTGACLEFPVGLSLINGKIYICDHQSIRIVSGMNKKSFHHSLINLLARENNIITEIKTV